MKEMELKQCPYDSNNSCSDYSENGQCVCKSCEIPKLINEQYESPEIQ